MEVANKSMQAVAPEIRQQELKDEYLEDMDISALNGAVTIIGIDNGKRGRIHADTQVSN